MVMKTKSALSIIISASSIGTVIEWYDFIIYILLAGTIAPLFFPNENKYISLLLTPTAKPPPLAVRITKALPLRELQVV